MGRANKNIQLIVSEALEKPPEERAAYLDQVCADNSSLRKEAESLLGLEAKLGGFLETPAAYRWALPNESSLTEEPGSVIGRYRLVERIGEGGMAVVYRAEQIEPVWRQVALKIVKLGMDTKQVIARLEAERQALAILDHPDIATIYDGGTTEGGRPYFVMELVDGPPITTYCSQESVSFKCRLQLFTQVCDAVHYAHEAGIIHRDLKPINVLVSARGEHAIPKIIDFGIAKVLQSEYTEDTLFTEHGQLIGTPAYMSPEQAGFHGRDLDQRTDVYSLGVLLYELLTGTTPVDKKEFQGIRYDEICRTVREAEPPKPSTRLSTLGRRSDTAVRKQPMDRERFRRMVRGDLDWIVMKALEKDPACRYQTAKDLSVDVQRYLNDLPVSAGPPSAMHVVGKFIRRHRTVVMAMALVTVALVVGAAAAKYIGLSLMPTTPHHARGMVQRHVWDLPFYSTPSGAISLDGRLVPYVDWTAGNLGLYNIAQDRYGLVTKNMEWADTGGWAHDAVAAPDGRRVVYSWCKEGTDGRYDLRIFDADQGESRVLCEDVGTSYFYPYDWSADGRYVLVYHSKMPTESVIQSSKASSAAGYMARVSVDQGSATSIRAFESDWYPRAALFSPDGRFIVYDLAQRDNPYHRDIFTLDLETNDEDALVQHVSDDRLIGWSPDGEWILFTSDRTGPVSLWGIRMTGKRPVDDAVLLISGFDGESVGFTADGAFYYSRSISAFDVYAALLDDAGLVREEPPKLVSSGFVGRTFKSDWSPDGRFLAYRVDTGSGPADTSGGSLLAFAIYSINEDRERVVTPLVPLRGHWANCGPRWSPDGQTLLVFALTDEHGPAAYTVDIATGAVEFIGATDRTIAAQAVWSADGTAVFVRGALKRQNEKIVTRLSRIELATGEETELNESPWSPKGLDLSPDGQWLAFWQGERSLVVIPASGGEPKEIVRLAVDEKSGSLSFARWAPDGTYLLFPKRQTELWRVNVRTGKQKPVGLTVKTLVDAAVHPDGRRIAFSVEQPGQQLWVMEDFLPDREGSNQHKAD